LPPARYWKEKEEFCEHFFFKKMKKNWAVGRIGIRASTEWPHARDLNLFSRHIRAKKNAHDSLERFLPLFRVRKVLFFTSLCVRAVGSTICSFFREKRWWFFKIHILLGNQQQNKNPRYRKGSKRDEREREQSRERRERERKREKERRNTYRWIYGQFVWYGPFWMIFFVAFFLFSSAWNDLKII